MNQYFPPHKSNNEITVKLGLSSHATKDNLKNLNANTSYFALKANLAGLKIKVDKLENVPTDLTKLNNAVQNDVLRKADAVILF